MFCPKCSQQQPPEMRFCSRCGFALGVVALALENDGVLPAAVDEASQKKRSTRNRIMGESAIFTLVAWLLALGATAWFDYGGAVEGAVKIGAAIFFTLGLIGLLRFLYGFLLVKDLAPSQSTLTATEKEHLKSAEPIQAALPAQQSVPISDYPRRVNTREMVPRTSVTEGTTRLLDD